jgi:hypothetical protein
MHDLAGVDRLYGVQTKMRFGLLVPLIFIPAGRFKSTIGRAHRAHEQKRIKQLFDPRNGTASRPVRIDPPQAAATNTRQQCAGRPAASTLPGVVQF